MNGRAGIAGYIGSVSAVIAAGLFTLLILIDGVHAGDCAPVRVSGSPEISRLQRQIAANRALETKYGCDIRSTFACREIAGRIAQARSRMVSLSRALQQVCRKADVAERAPVHRSRASADRSATTAHGLPRLSAKLETRCVRLSDGYSFPTPNSGYNTAKDMETIAAQCKFICDDPAMDVYKITGEDRNTDEMISVTTGARYAELQHAGAYKTVSSLKTCDMNRFYKAVMAQTPAAASAVTAVSQAALLAEDAVVDVALLGDVGLRGTTNVVPAPPRKIRIVGAAFLPEQ